MTDDKRPARVRLSIVQRSSGSIETVRPFFASRPNARRMIKPEARDTLRASEAED
jgi:hypothetical protein